MIPDDDDDDDGDDDDDDDDYDDDDDDDDKEEEEEEEEEEQEKKTTTCSAWYSSSSPFCIFCGSDFLEISRSPRSVKPTLDSHGGDPRHGQPSAWHLCGSDAGDWMGY